MEDTFDVNDHYINVVIPFDKEVVESRAKSRLALNDGDDTTQLALNNGTHPSFSEEELKKLVKSRATKEKELRSA